MVKKRVKWKVIGLGVGIIVGFILLGFLLPRMGFEIEPFSPPYGYILVLLTGMLLAISAFLPYTWGKILRELALLSFFILFLWVEVNVVKPYVQAADVKKEECKNYFIPSTSGKIIYDALKYTSCVLTGYFPTEEGDLGWTVFYLFYIILPFVFIWTLLYSLTKPILLRWFGDIGNIRPDVIFSFIISIYAARTLLGGFLLNYAGYGAWGIGGLFIAILFTKVLGNMMEKWFEVEKVGKETREFLEAERTRLREFAKTILKEVIPVCRDTAKADLLAAQRILRERVVGHEYYRSLGDDVREIIGRYLFQMSVTNDTNKFEELLNEFEKLLKTWTK